MSQIQGLADFSEFVNSSLKLLVAQDIPNAFVVNIERFLYQSALEFDGNVFDVSDIVAAGAGLRLINYERIQLDVRIA
jgi:hypothetical protein